MSEVVGSFGALLHAHRVQLGWTARQLSILYSEAIGKEDDPIDVSFIYHLEAGKMKIVDQGRRAVLARLVDIPLAAAGISIVAAETTNPFAWKKVNVREYGATLETYCASWQSGTTYKVVKDIKQRVTNLERASFYSFSPEKGQMAELLCWYEILAADVVGEHVTGASTQILTQAVNVAKQEKLYDVYAHALRQRAGSTIDTFERTRDFSILSSALNDFQASESVQPKVSPFFQAMVDVRRGLAYAYMAKDQGGFTSAMNIIDRSAAQIGMPNTDKKVAARLDTERYYFNRASAYLYSPQGSPKAALKELDQATALKPNTSPRRQVHRDLLYAEAYYALQNYPMSVAHAESGAETSTLFGMDTLLGRLDTVYHNLRGSSYGSDPDVARLGVTLLKAQHPELFA